MIIYWKRADLMNSNVEKLVNETVFKTNVEIIRKVVRYFHITVQEALNVLEIPESEHTRYISSV